MNLARKLIPSPGGWVLILITLIGNVLAPTGWCFDCEFDPRPGQNQWGHHLNGWEGCADLLTNAAPFIAGLLGLRGLIVPFAATAIVLFTQPLAGVAWWSLKNNEGPIILIFLLPMFCFFFVAGLVIRFCWRLVRAYSWVYQE